MVEYTKTEIIKNLVLDKRARVVFLQVKCGSCYGAESPQLRCCNTCQDVRSAYLIKGWALPNPPSIRIEQCKGEVEWAKQKGEGCQVFGTIDVGKVAGNFHIAPGKSFQRFHVHVHYLQELSSIPLNMSHQIRSLSFGERFPGVKNPLDGLKVTKMSVYDLRGSYFFADYSIMS